MPIPSIIDKIVLFKLFNVGLRILPLGLKFILITTLSKYFDTAVYGDYSLITATITISIFVLGLDFYNFSIRDILTEKDNIVEKLASTFFLYLFIYFFFFIIGSLLFRKIEFMHTYGLISVLGICVTEHLSQEIYRLHIAFKKVLLGNLIFFLRVSIWTGYILVNLLFFDSKPTIEGILQLWLFSNIFSFVISFLTLGKNLKKLIPFPKIEISYLVKGLRISFVFFLGTIALKCIEYVNRYIVDYFLGSEETGIFSFYANLALIITVYVNAIVISFELPALIEKTGSKDLNLHFKNFRNQMLKQIAFVSVLVIFITKPILIWQSVKVYDNYFPILFLLLLGVALMNFSLVYHFFLYILNKDSTILRITLKSCFVNLILTISLTFWGGLYGTALAFFLTGLYMFFERRRNAISANYD
ncbi:hypothetical protein MTsPCn5_32450 [Croceitalea sp. MTPC5]|uniref:lipopolysaccharide biosynthesis protein n=1 Tax=Croceitalea sp. MTPC5 TaxID=3056565 RepID=UPI002B36D925|nr:hypothetical protein MTsPCn5_32450 [Croceitalea sp. MTPC5]